MNNIDARLRVKVNVKFATRAVCKEFNLSSNYPKGDGDVFHSFMEEHCPHALLQPVKQVNGNQHDVVTEMA